MFNKYELEDGTVVQVQGLEASSSSSGGEQEAAGAAPAALPIPSPEELEAAEAAVKEQADRIRAMKEVEGLKNAVSGAGRVGTDVGAACEGTWKRYQVWTVVQDAKGVDGSTGHAPTAWRCGTEVGSGPVNTSAMQVPTGASAVALRLRLRV